MLKWIAICSNTILLLTVLIMFTKHVLSGGTVDGYDIFMFVLILGTAYIELGSFVFESQRW